MTIRKYMVVGMALIVVFPWFIYGLVHGVDTHAWQAWHTAKHPSPGHWAQDDIKAAIAALLAVTFAISFVGWQIRRNLIRPLEAMGHAAHQIAEGDLDVHLPGSGVKEIRQVKSAYHVMVSGLRDAFAKQAKLEEERRFFISAIAHDLRTPLFSLRGHLDGLAEGIASSPEMMERYVNICKEKADHLDRLVADLFAFTKLEYMEQTLQREPCNLATVVHTATETMRPLADEKNIHLDESTGNGLPVVTGDAHLLERAIINLLDNAIRHSPQNGTIVVQLSPQDGGIQLTVQDSGSGFAEDDLARIFDPLYRGDTSRNLATGGAGLGLTIARRIFQAHGGQLTAANANEGGAVLTGWIPIYR